MRRRKRQAAGDGQLRMLGLGIADHGGDGA